jgi:hypothetical protein
MIKGYRFVYSLTYDNCVFYIGCTNNIIKRYKQHLSGADNAYTITKIRLKLDSILERGHFPDMNIIDYLPDKEAFELESTLIKYISLTGHILDNSRGIKEPSKLPSGMPKLPTERQMRRALKYKLDWYLRHKIGPSVIAGIYQPYPNNPFIINIKQ